ncbi:hypothetical protein SUGI_0336460 [Cryptomeria japonica]|nr:hypothetical protein SUGI_0336460 [Cryptomeria japonica]
MDDDANSQSDSHQSLQDVFESLKDLNVESFFQNLYLEYPPETENEEIPTTFLPIQSADAEAGPSKEIRRDVRELALAYENLPAGTDVVAWESVQSRSRKHVSFVRRRIVNRKFTKWQIEIRIPPSLVQLKTKDKWDVIRQRQGLPAFTDKQFAEEWKKKRDGKKKTEYVEARGLLEVKRNWQIDIEAEVAGSVLAMIYDDYASADWEKNNPGQPRKKSYGRRFIRFHGCRWLIDEQIRRGNPVPDLRRDDNAVRNYVFECSRIFKEIAEQKKKDGGYEVPEVLLPPVTEYIENGWRFDRVYSEFWPDPKLNYAPSVNKRKPGNAVGIRSDVGGAWIVLEVTCESHSETRYMRWTVAPDTCLCKGVEFRIEDSVAEEDLALIPIAEQNSGKQIITCIKY